MKLEELQAAFITPDRKYGPTPFWGLNDDLDPDRLRASLREFASKGWAGVFMHPRTGLEVPYLSETWWERVAVILDECRRLGLKAWIYDEYNWPSGPAGGRALDGHPEFLMPYLEYAYFDLGRGRRPRERGIARAAFLVGDTVSDVSEHISDGRFAPPDHLEGQGVLFYEDLVTDNTCATSNAPWCSGVTGYLDLMNPDAVERFLELTHREYVRRFPEHVGTTIPGVFTDEPQFYRGFPWTGRFAAAFRKRKGYDPVPSLYMLVEDRAGYRQFRIDYYDVVERLYAEAFYEKTRKFCDAHGLIYTGHLGMEERLHEIPVNHGGIWRPLKAMTMPGIDALGDGNPVTGGLVNMASPHFSPRAAAVISRVYGDGQVLCETGGGSGWEATPFSLKLQLDWLYASGVTFVNPHQSLLSVKGHRKRDFPPFHSPAEPWFEFYSEFARYIARMGAVMTAGEPVIELGLGVPTAALRSVCPGRGAGRSREAEKVLTPFHSLLEFLVRNQRDFELLFEDAADDGVLTVEPGVLRQGPSAYRLVILPPAAVIGAALADVLAAYLDAGGRLVVFDQLPEYDSAGNGVTAKLLAPFRRAEAEGRAVQLSSSAGFSREGVLAALERLLPADVTIAPPVNDFLGCRHRRVGDADLYFIANLSPAALEAEITFREARPALEQWDPLSGEVRPVAWKPAGGDGARVTIAFEAGQSLCLVWRAAPEAEWPHLLATDLKLIGREGPVITGYSAAARVTAESDRGVIEREAAVPPLPLTLSPEWKLTPEAGNVFLVGPWDVTTDRAEAGPLPALEDEYYFTARTRRLIRFARPLIKLIQAVRSPGKKHRGERYFNFGQAERTETLATRVTGIDLARWGLYEKIEALTRLRDHLGLEAIMQSFPPAGAEFEARAVFEIAYEPADLLLVFEDLGAPISFEVNGAPLLNAAPAAGAWDPACRAFPLAGAVRPGKNVIRMKGRQLDYLAFPPHAHSLEPVALMGTFAVKDGKVVAPDPAPSSEGDWVRRGYPNYSGAMNFSATINVPEEFLQYHLLLDFLGIKECAELFVNGRSAGVRICPAFSFPVSGLVQAGDNELRVRVVNTGANFFARPRRSGILGPVRIAPYVMHRVDLREASDG